MSCVARSQCDFMICYIQSMITISRVICCNTTAFTNFFYIICALYCNLIVFRSSYCIESQFVITCRGVMTQDLLSSMITITSVAISSYNTTAVTTTDVQFVPCSVLVLWNNKLGTRPVISPRRGDQSLICYLSFCLIIPPKVSQC